jgi:hypothetical protein
MTLVRADLDKLLNFLGYGTLAAPFWFLGMEEGTAGAQEVQHNIQIRLKAFTPMMDLATAHNAAHLNRPMDAQTRFTSVWMFMAKIVRALRGETDWQDSAAAKRYVREQLGRADGETFLTELLPLPKPNAGAWLSDYTAWYPTRSDYEQSVLPQRKALLKQLLREHRPQYLLCYGRVNYPHYRETTGAAIWRTLAGSTIEIGEANGTRVALLPFLGNGGISHNKLQALFDLWK